MQYLSEDILTVVFGGISIVITDVNQFYSSKKKIFSFVFVLSYFVFYFVFIVLYSITL